MPLALGSVACLWRRVTEEALAGSERSTRGLFFSKNYSAIGTVVRAGLAATVLPGRWSASGLRVLGPETGLPDLPPTRMGLIHPPGRETEETRALADAIRGAIAEPMRRAA